MLVLDGGSTELVLGGAERVDVAACDELAALSPAETAALSWLRADREDVLAAGVRASVGGEHSAPTQRPPTGSVGA
ncbi:hypothetical protein [Rathayibacter rathayi]|uniref:hypothetical protein n=1 Tax=Rathayibacter rathayi TaxID=33887 RepID=UPI003B967ADA